MKTKKNNKKQQKSNTPFSLEIWKIATPSSEILKIAAPWLGNLENRRAELRNFTENQKINKILDV